MRLSIVVPSYRRTARLRACLDAVAAARFPDHEVIVASRFDDAETIATARAHRCAPRIVEVETAGVLAAMRAGVVASGGELVAFLDDDTQIGADWFERLSAYLERADVGCVSGRDRTADDSAFPLKLSVGRIHRYGRVVGNHHVATGSPRDVDVVKGANMLWRRDALALPLGLRGAGAEVHYEIATCRWATLRGYRLAFDPGTIVEHRAGERFDADRRNTPDMSATEDSAHNLVMALGSGRTCLGVTALGLYGLFVGDRGAPGIVRACVAVLRRDPLTARRLRWSLRGRLAAHLRLLRGDVLEMATFAEPGTELRAAWTNTR